jgi:hypothetical protein
MGVHKEPNYKIYWETPRPNGPVHALLKHMSLNRYENLRRYFYISPLEPPIDSLEEDSLEEGVD